MRVDNALVLDLLKIQHFESFSSIIYARGSVTLPLRGSKGICQDISDQRQEMSVNANQSVVATKALIAFSDEKSGSLEKARPNFFTQYSLTLVALCTILHCKILNQYLKGRADEQKACVS